MEREHDDSDAPQSARRALRRLIADGIKPGDLEAAEVAEELFGRPDALDLVQEVLVERRLAGVLDADAKDTHHGTGEGGATVRSRARPALSLHTGSSGQGAGKSWRKLAIAAAVLLAFGLASSSVAIRLLRNGIDTQGAAEYSVASTGAAELDTLGLPDGSRVILAPNTKLRYSIAPDRGPRRVELDGEAYFDVIHDEHRPFRVETRNAVVTDLGTSFVVREYVTDGRARVAIRSGAASVQPRNQAPTPPITMHPGDGAYVDSQGAISRFSSDPESYGTWTNGHLAFDATALPDVLEQLGHWYDVRFQLADSMLNTEYFTGEFRSVSLADALAILGPVVHARFEQKGRVVVVTARSAGR